MKITSRLICTIVRYILVLILFLPVLASGQKTEVDTTSSKTKLFVALNTTNAIYKKEEYEIQTKKLDFTGIILNSLNDKYIIKGCRMYAGNYGRSAVAVYFDENEIQDIILTLKYIQENINLEDKPNHDVWIYYKTADNFEVGSKADKGKKYRIYFRKNYRYLADGEVTLSRKDLDEVLDSFVAVRDFLKVH